MVRSKKSKIVFSFPPESMKRTVGHGGSSGRVYVPKEWIGSKVMVVLLEGEE